MPGGIRELGLAIGFHKQSALQTALVAADMWALSQTSRAVGQPQLVLESNAADIGKGHEWATQLFKSNWDMPWSWDARLTSENAAMLAAFGLGVVSKATAGAGFKYTFIPLDPITDNLVMPVTTLVQAVRQGASDFFDFALIGMALNEFRVMLRQGPGRDNATMTSTWTGCGKFANPSTITLPNATVEHPLNAGGATTLTVSGVDYIANQRFVSMEFGWQNNPRLDSGFYPGSGSQDGASIRGRMRHGDRACFLNFVVEMEADSAERTKMEALTEGAANIVVAGDYLAGSAGAKHTLEVTWPRLIFKTTPIGETDGLITIAVDCEILKDPSDEVVTMEVTTLQDEIGEAA